jgi:hypothetical protein
MTTSRETAVAEINWLMNAVKPEDTELYLRWASGQWQVIRYRSLGDMPTTKVLIVYGRKYDALEELRGAGFSTNHAEHPAGELWTRDPRKDSKATSKSAGAGDVA